MGDPDMTRTPQDEPRRMTSSSYTQDLNLTVRNESARPGSGAQNQARRTENNESSGSRATKHHLNLVSTVRPVTSHLRRPAGFPAPRRLSPPQLTGRAAQATFATTFATAELPRASILAETVSTSFANRAAALKRAPRRFRHGNFRSNIANLHEEVRRKIQNFVFTFQLPDHDPSLPIVEITPGQYRFPKLLRISSATRKLFASTYYPQQNLLGSAEDVKDFLKLLPPEHRAWVRNIYTFVKKGAVDDDLRLPGKGSNRRQPISPGTLSMGGVKQRGFDCEAWKQGEKQRLKVGKELEELCAGDGGKREEGPRKRIVVRIFEFEQQLCQFVVGAKIINIST